MKALEQLKQELSKITVMADVPLPPDFEELHKLGLTLTPEVCQEIKQAFVRLLRNPELLDSYAEWLTKTTGESWQRRNLHAEEMVLEFVADKLEGEN